MIKKKIVLFASLLVVACTAEPVIDNVAGELPLEDIAATAKFINTPYNAQQGSLVVYFDDAATPTIEATAAAADATRAEGKGDVVLTRSGIEPVDNVMQEIGVTSLRRVFPYNPKHEERTRAAGLHRWYVVTFDKGADLEATALKLAKVGEVQNIEFNTKLDVAWEGPRVPLTAADMAATRAAGSTNGGFNDPQLSRQWHYINNGSKTVASTARAGADINVKDAWELTGGNSAVVVAIVDQGIKYTHPDLAANMWTNTTEKNGGSGTDDDGNGYKDDIYGYNFAARGAITWDHEVWVNNQNVGDSGHGTHVAGTVAAVNNNGIGVSGVAGGTGRGDGVRLMSCQIFSGDAPGSGAISTSAEAIKYAADNGASIIQCSWGYQGGAMSSDNSFERNMGVEYNAIKYFIETKNCDAIDGGLAIFAAGNDAKAMSGYPAAYRDYISVTAFSADNLPAYYTNYGPGSNIAAPGGEYTISADPQKTYAMILSTVPSELTEYDGSDYAFAQGTSMACPHMSGVAALGLSYALDKGKKFTLDEFKSMLLTSVNDMETFLDGSKEGLNLADYRKKMGTGSTDAYQLLMQIEGTPCLRAKVGTKQVIALTKYFGGSASNLTYLSVEMTQADKDKLGITDEPSISYGKLSIHCKKPGVAKIKITAVGGGENVGGGNTMGGMEITKEFAIIARATNNKNGGWL
jgi:subtilisin family serine protease